MLFKCTLCDAIRCAGKQREEAHKSEGVIEERGKILALQDRPAGSLYVVTELVLTYIYTYIYTYMYVYTCICIYVYMYIYTYRYYVMTELVLSCCHLFSWCLV